MRPEEKMMKQFITTHGPPASDHEEYTYIADTKNFALIATIATVGGSDRVT